MFNVFHFSYSTSQADTKILNKINNKKQLAVYKKLKPFTGDRQVPLGVQRGHPAVKLSRHFQDNVAVHPGQIGESGKEVPADDARPERSHRRREEGLQERR